MGLIYVFACIILNLAYANISAANGEHTLERTLKEQLQDITLDVAQLNTRLTELSAIDKLLETTVAALQKQLTSVTGHTDKQACSGSTYIRWGKKTCPGNGTSLVYSGVAVGASHSAPGGQALCMPPNPIYGDHVPTGRSANVYGVRYQTVDNSTLNKDMSCSLCQTSRLTVIMLPGMNICPEGWTLEYNGWLAAGAYEHSSSEYICLDRQPEALQNHGSNDAGCLFNPVKGICGSLPCPPYRNYKTLSCAVCSK